MYLTKCTYTWNHTAHFYY